MTWDALSESQDSVLSADNEFFQGLITSLHFLDLHKIPSVSYFHQ